MDIIINHYLLKTLQFPVRLVPSFLVREVIFSGASLAQYVNWRGLIDFVSERVAVGASQILSNRVCYRTWRGTLDVRAARPGAASDLIPDAYATRSLEEIFTSCRSRRELPYILPRYNTIFVQTHCAVSLKGLHFLPQLPVANCEKSERGHNALNLVKRAVIEKFNWKTTCYLKHELW